jgi:hypothetical protein
MITISDIYKVCIACTTIKWCVFTTETSNKIQSITMFNLIKCKTLSSIPKLAQSLHSHIKI